jgi:hypothetical protein
MSFDKELIKLLKDNGIEVSSRGQIKESQLNKASTIVRKYMKSKMSGKGEVFVIWASSGRMNGYAVVMAKSKSDAKAFAKGSEWLNPNPFESGKVDKVQTLKEYLKETGDDEEHIQAEIDQLKKIGDVVGIEWGT